MKKIFLTAAACIIASMFVSCNNKAESTTQEPEVSVPRCTRPEVKLDSLSYVAGISFAKEIEMGIMPQFKADHSVIVSTIEESLNGKTSFKVGDVEITKENMNELAMQYFNPELREKVIAAMNDSTGNTEVFDNPTEKRIASTLLGMNIAMSTANVPFDIQTESFIKALDDVHNDAQIITDEKAKEIVNNYFNVVLPAENAKHSKEWLAEIEKEEGVMKTESGLLYKIIDEGDKNVKAKADTDVVKVLYTGKTRKDVTFDSNRWIDMPQESQEMIKAHQPDMAKDNPIEFPLNGVIPGWTEGMKLVGKGGRIHLWIPSELAYGERAASQEIGPNEALFFDVELLEVTPAK